MLAADIMNTNLALVSAEATVFAVAREMLQKKTSHVLVTGSDGALLGLISGYDLRKAVADNRLDLPAAELMTGREQLHVAAMQTPLTEVADVLSRQQLTQMPVLQDEIPVGYLNLDTVLDYIKEARKQSENELQKFRQASLIISSMREGLIVVDTDYIIREFNPAAELLCGLRAAKMVGRPSQRLQVPDSPLRTVMETGKPLENMEITTADGRVFLTNTAPVMRGAQLIGVIHTFTDITEIKQMQRQLENTRDELDKAFALTLPNSRVEHKLKNTPEYRDTFHRDSGLVEITEVIENGGYLHVVNALKVAADLNEKGIMSLVGINKDILVETLIFHDVGKSQPILRVGQKVDPKRVFEDGKLHALRSAEIARHFYGKSDDVATLIRYHHHQEEELPADFPVHLLPMWRLVKLIDGLSAGLTRRSARIAFRLTGTRLTVMEKSCHPYYNRTTEVDLYTGTEFMYTEKQVKSVQREALEQ